MVRVSMVGTLLLLGAVVPVFATHRTAARTPARGGAAGPKAGLDGAPLLPANGVGTWRLDSLLDGATISGIDPSDVDPATFVLHDLRFDGAAGGIVPAELPFGSGKVATADGTARLTATGKAAAFKIKVPKTKASEVGAIAYRLRSSDCSEVALLRDTSALSMFGPNGGGPGGPGGGNFGVPFGGGGPPIPFAGGRFGGARGGGAGGPPGGRPPQGGPPGGGPPGGGPPAGGAPQGQGGAPAGGAPTGVGAPPVGGPPPGGGPGPGGPGFGPGGDGGVANLLGDMNPRDLLGNEVRKLESDGEWHTLARTNKAGGGGNRFMGMPQQSDPNAPLEELALVLLVPADKAESGVTVDLEFIHVLDSKADYAAKTAAPCTLERDRGVLHSGMHLNTPASVTWRLVPPADAKLIAGLTALNDEPFKLLIHATAGGKRETLLDRYCEGGDAVEPLALDLSAYAGQETALEVEVIEESEPNVAFLLQPLVYGARKEGVRNVMLYFCDTLRADALSSYGNTRPTTPNLDALAADGIRFERCFSQGAWTYVSMPSSLSSLFPSVNGVKMGGEQIAGSVTTIAEAFREAGYLTAAFIRNDFVGPTTHTEQGFDFFFPGNVIGNGGVQQAVARMFGRNPLNADAGQGGMNFNSGSSRDLFVKARPWLDQYRDVPFVLYLHAVDPHDPYNPDQFDRAKFMSAEDDAQFAAMETKLNDYRMEQQRLQQQQFGGPGGGNLAVGPGGVVQSVVAAPRAAPPVAPAPAAGDATPAAPDAATDVGAPAAAAPAATPAADAAAPAPGRVRGSEAMDEYIAAGVDPHEFMRLQRIIYDAELHYFDRHYKQLRDYFAEHGLTQHSIFSFNADHGEEFLDHGATGHGQSVYAELNHVPWILSAPGLLPTGKVVGDNVANVDLGPTLLGLAGVTPPDTMQGRNLAAELANGDELPAFAIFTEKWEGGMFGGGNGGDANGEILGSFAVIEGRWKTIVHRTLAPAVGADGKPTGKQELKIDYEVYDLLADMTDSNDLVASERPRAEAANQRLELWVAEMRKLNARYAGEQTENDGALDMIRALGYAQ